MKYTTLFFDADDTLLDFGKCEHGALKKTFEKYGLSFDAAIEKRYEEINNSLWAAFERGEIAKTDILNTRFRKLFAQLSIENVDKDFERQYQSFLASDGCTIEGALELCRELSQDFDLYILTNGVAATQHGRFQDSGLLPFIKGIFVSEEIGFQKPDLRYFEAVLERLEYKDKKRILMIGDSLNSDILGGNHAGIAACWYNPGHKANDTTARPDYEVDSYEGLKKILY